MGFVAEIYLCNCTQNQVVVLLRVLEYNSNSPYNICTLAWLDLKIRGIRSGPCPNQSQIVPSSCSLIGKLHSYTIFLVIIIYWEQSKRHIYKGLSSTAAIAYRCSCGQRRAVEVVAQHRAHCGRSGRPRCSSSALMAPQAWRTLAVCNSTGPWAAPTRPTCGLRNPP